jgi:hypothetical protein
MKAAIVFLSLLLFATFGVSLIFASNNFRNLQTAAPDPPVLGPITAIRNSFGRLHHPEDASVCPGCLAYLRPARIGASAAAAA